MLRLKIFNDEGYVKRISKVIVESDEMQLHIFSEFVEMENRNSFGKLIIRDDLESQDIFISDININNFDIKNTLKSKAIKEKGFENIKNSIFAIKISINEYEIFISSADYPGFIYLHFKSNGNIIKFGVPEFDLDQYLF